MEGTVIEASSASDLETAPRQDSLHFPWDIVSFYSFFMVYIVRTVRIILFGKYFWDKGRWTHCHVVLFLDKST